MGALLPRAKPIASRATVPRATAITMRRAGMPLVRGCDFTPRRRTTISHRAATTAATTVSSTKAMSSGVSSGALKVGSVASGRS